MTARERVERIEQECSGVWGQSGVSTSDRQFLASVKSRQTLSEKQEKWLKDIEQRVFGGDDE